MLQLYLDEDPFATHRRRYPQNLSFLPLKEMPRDPDAIMDAYIRQQLHENEVRKLQAEHERIRRTDREDCQRLDRRHNRVDGRKRRDRGPDYEPTSDDDLLKRLNEEHRQRQTVNYRTDVPLSRDSGHSRDLRAVSVPDRRWHERKAKYGGVKDTAPCQESWYSQSRWAVNVAKLEHHFDGKEYVRTERYDLIDPDNDPSEVRNKRQLFEEKRRGRAVWEGHGGDPDHSSWSRKSTPQKRFLMSSVGEHYPVLDPRGERQLVEKSRTDQPDLSTNEMMEDATVRRSRTDADFLVEQAVRRRDRKARREVEREDWSVLGEGDSDYGLSELTLDEWEVLSARSDPR